MNGRPADERSGTRRDASADSLLAALTAAEGVEQDLIGALHRTLSVDEENSLRRADAIRAAAMGLDTAACASAAGVPESLLLSWRAGDPSFDAALSAATAMARAHHLEQNVTSNPAALRVVLAALRDGMTIVEAGALVGMTRDAFYHLRRADSRLHGLIAAARALGRRKERLPKRRMPASRRRSDAFKGYRLVRLEPPPRSEPGES
ncbi:hypothetical protein ACFVS9_28570 [Streptomyces sp. NPDC058008]|uniref:hypothetical protein n=1 Tax=Streptomyces sp. NPDC058008 TaxID=3346303 RepID=UPI0036EB7DAA